MKSGTATTGMHTSFFFLFFSNIFFMTMYFHPLFKLQDDPRGEGEHSYSSRGDRVPGQQWRQPWRAFPLHELHPSITVCWLLIGQLSTRLWPLHPETHSPQSQQRAGSNGCHDPGNTSFTFLWWVHLTSSACCTFCKASNIHHENTSVDFSDYICWYSLPAFL